MRWAPLLYLYLSFFNHSFAVVNCPISTEVKLAHDDLEKINRHENDLLLKLTESAQIRTKLEKVPNKVIFQRIETVVDPHFYTHIYRVFGKISESGKEELLAEFTAGVKNNIMTITSSSVHEEAQGLGIQSTIYKKLGEYYPEIKIFKGQLTSDNKNKFLSELKKMLSHYPEYKNVDDKFSIIDDQFGNCCSEVLNKLDPVKKQEIIQKAMQSTPAYKSRISAGFKDFCGDGAKMLITNKGSTKFYIKLNLDMCRP